MRCPCCSMSAGGNFSNWAVRMEQILKYIKAVNEWCLLFVWNTESLIFIDSSVSRVRSLSKLNKLWEIQLCDLRVSLSHCEVYLCGLFRILCPAAQFKILSRVRLSFTLKILLPWWMSLKIKRVPSSFITLWGPGWKNSVQGTAWITASAAAKPQMTRGPPVRHE